MAKRILNRSVPVDPSFVAMLLRFTEGEGPGAGRWGLFQRYCDEVGFPADEIEKQCVAIRVAAGQVPD